MSPIKFIILLTSLLIILIASVTIYIYDVTAYGLPSFEQLENPRQNFATQVLSSDGELLDYFFEHRRIPLPIDSIPKDFLNALIATEDRTFFDHWGVHSARIAKAFIKNILAGSIQEGASTITMQLARNLFLNQENTLNRKVKEAIVAVQLEKTYTKKEILEMYSNTVAFGRGAYGINVAARIYFNKNPGDLTTAECAYLVAILKAPERYNGLKDMEKALNRRNLVLTLMFDQGFLDNDKYIKALEEPITLKTGSLKNDSYLAPHFVEMIRQRFSREDNSLYGYDLYRDGLIINTTLNSKIQKYANEAVEEHLLEFQKAFERSWSWKNNSELLNDLIRKAIRSRADYKAISDDKKKMLEQKLSRDNKFIDSIKNTATTIQTGLVVINPKTGEILAMVGASPKFMREHSDSKYSLNHVTQIHRQAGSAFKPFVYAVVLENGTSPDTLVECGPFTYRLATGELWSPQGTGNCENSGKVNLYKGLSASINTVAARLVTNVTNPSAVVSLARRLGINSSLRAVPAIALGGGGEITPLEITSAFGAFSFRGYHITPNYITQILDKNDNIIYEDKSNIKLKDVIHKNTSFKLTRLMQGVIEGGTGWRVRQFFKNIDAAGKTGTTNDNGDAWFIGYTPELVAGIWVGFDDLRIKLGQFGDGGRAAAPIWGRLMAKIYNDSELPFKERKFEFNIIDSTDSIYKQTYFTNTAIQKNIGSEKNSSFNKIAGLEGKTYYKNPKNFPSLPRKKEEHTGLNW